MDEEISQAAVEALQVCNYDFCRRWSDLDYMGQESPSDTYRELEELYDVSSEFGVAYPFPLRFFMRMALIERGKKVDDLRFKGIFRDEPVYMKATKDRQETNSEILQSNDAEVIFGNELELQNTSETDLTNVSGMNLEKNPAVVLKSNSEMWWEDNPENGSESSMEINSDSNAENNL